VNFWINYRVYNTLETNTNDISYIINVLGFMCSLNHSLEKRIAQNNIHRCKKKHDKLQDASFTFAKSLMAFIWPSCPNIENDVVFSHLTYTP
jgi:hypothetical protein